MRKGSQICYEERPVETHNNVRSKIRRKELIFKYQVDLVQNWNCQLKLKLVIFAKGRKEVAPTTAGGSSSGHIDNKNINEIIKIHVNSHPPGAQNLSWRNFYTSPPQPPPSPHHHRPYPSHPHIVWEKKRGEREAARASGSGKCAAHCAWRTWTKADGKLILVRVAPVKTSLWRFRGLGTAVQRRQLKPESPRKLFTTWLE